MILESRLVRRTPHEHTHTHKMIFLFLAYLLFFSTQTFLSFTLFLFVLLLFIVLIPKTARARRHYIKSCRSMWVIAEMRQWPICYDYIIRQTYSITLCAWHTVYVYICHSKMDNKNVSKRKKRQKWQHFFVCFVLLEWWCWSLLTIDIGVTVTVLLPWIRCIGFVCELFTVAPAIFILCLCERFMSLIRE